jgi:RNA recognition motif. (a.k.a. RRM, RBD, or RNP domain)
VMKFSDSGRSRGFGFITFERAQSVDECQAARPHELDGKIIECKRATARKDAKNPEALVEVKKLWVGGFSEDTSDADIKEYFGQFGGKVLAVEQIRWPDSGKKRGFGFVEFADTDTVDKICLIEKHKIKGRRLEIKKALSKAEMMVVKSQQAAAAGGSSGNSGGMSWGSGGVGGGGAEGGNMNSGGFQQRQQNMGGGGGGGGGAVNPMMANMFNGMDMQSMFAMFMTSMMNNMAAGGGFGGMGGGNFGGGNMAAGAGSMGGNGGNMGGSSGNMGGSGGNMGGSGGNMGSSGGSMMGGGNSGGGWGGGYGGSSGSNSSGPVRSGISARDSSNPYARTADASSTRRGW